MTDSPKPLCPECGAPLTDGRCINAFCKLSPLNPTGKNVTKEK
jgi:hypothetical protein